ncbi:MAG: hypothetical protein P1U77_03185 [Rubripirellula sp.]|nr:hypothetical protein [Rubripirellula sp.]
MNVITGNWDRPATHLNLARLTAMRCRFRIRRTLHRIRSPRRVLATALAVAFFLLYLINGVFILSSREQADPERLRLWLSGGMVLYAMYHCLRCVWSSRAASDSELTAAEALWLGGAPVRRSSLATYHVGSMVLPTLLKTLLLTVVLAMDVQYVPLLVIGIFCSLLLLEIIRLLIARWSTGISHQQKRRFRTAITCIAAAAAVQVMTRMIVITPFGSPTLIYLLNGFKALGQLAASEIIQWLAVPWIAAANLAIEESFGLSTLGNLFIAIGSLPVAIITLVKVDAWSQQCLLQRERQRLDRGQTNHDQNERFDVNRTEPSRWRQTAARFAPAWASDTIAVISRQWVSVVRYRSTIAFSFAVPTLLCLSPLLTGQATEQWFFVVGGIAMCTMLLAPPALRIDFRRDLKRMLLLRSLPVAPLSMVIGQLALPVMITWSYQWLTRLVAIIAIGPGWPQLLMWTGLLNALAVITFAAENAIFLTYPHHEHAEGLAMMIRAKLSFLGKATVIAVALGLLVAWAIWCRATLPASITMAAFVTGSLTAAWATAIATILAAKSCWQRYDLCHDIPPA